MTSKSVYAHGEAPNRNAMALFHSLDNDTVRRAYRRGDAKIERARMAQWWADQLDLLRVENSGNVVVLAKRL